MSLLDHPDAQALLADAVVMPEAVRERGDRLNDFLRRYLPRFYRSEQRATATLVIRGRLSGLERKTSEPIAIEAGLPRKPVQFFVGSGKWDDEAVMAELRGHVREELAESAGVVVVDGSAFPKKGAESCGVGRQWCGRLGKVDNCQVGVFLAYAAEGGYAPLDRRLYLPEDWAGDEGRREKCHVPPGVEFREKWQIALDLLERSLPGLPHGWITGDDEFGRASEFRAKLRLREERYVLDVPCSTTIRDLERRRPPRKRAGVGRRREVPFARADAWAAGQPESRWERVAVRGGEKGPLAVDAMTVRVRAKQERRIGPEERLVVIRAVGESRIDYALTNAGSDVPLAEVVRSAAAPPRRGDVRHRQRRGGAGPLRGEGLGGLAPPHDVVAGGPVVLVPGTAPGRGGKPRRSRCRRCGRSWHGCSATRPRPPRRLPAWSRGCCGVTRSRGSTTGTRRPGSSRRAVRDPIRAERLRIR
jgi:SRSO17 transposase